MGSRKNRISKGFTLLELLIVISIIGVLCGLLGGGVMMAIKSARKTESSQMIASLYTATEMYANEYGTYPLDSVHDDEDGQNSDLAPELVGHVHRLSMNREEYNKPKADQADFTQYMLLHLLDSYLDYPVTSSLTPRDANGVSDLKDPYDEPYVFKIIDPEDGDTSEGGGGWWKERGVTHRVKIYSVGAVGRTDTDPYWTEWDESDIVFRRTGE